jgi:branched-chain amino acid transport system ATP-binding protein
MSDNLLTLAGVHTHIGAYHILHGVDLAVPRGQLTMLLGRNGAGKTTTLRTIMGLWRASQGASPSTARTSRMPTPQIAGLGIAYVPENMGIFADLTVKENMLLAARGAKHAAQIDDTAAEWIFKLFPAVEKFWNHPAGKLSGGQKQMLAVSRAIVEPRELLIIDEPSKGLAPGHHQQHDRRLRAAEGERRDHPAGRAEHQLRQAAGRHRGRDGQRRRGARGLHEGAGGRRGNCSARCWGWRYELERFRLEAAGAGARCWRSSCCPSSARPRPGSRSPSPAWRWA